VKPHWLYHLINRGVIKAKVDRAVKLLNPRHAMTLLRGPMTRDELRRARGGGEAEGVAAQAPTGSVERSGPRLPAWHAFRGASL
jgi:hypothetical protein